MVTKDTLLECFEAFQRISQEALLMLRGLNAAFNEMDEDFKRRAQKLNIVEFPALDQSDGPLRDRQPPEADSQLNKKGKNSALCSRKTKKFKENIMPKIKHISIYRRRDGNYHAVISFKGVRKDVVGKNKEDVIDRAKDTLEDLGGSVGLTRNFNEFVRMWFETVKRPFISAAYYETLLNRFNVHVAPHFAGKRINQIKPFDLQCFFNALCMQTTRAAEDVKIIFNQIFEYAVGNGLIKVNPMRAVIVLKHERQNGSALERDEIETFKSKLNEVADYKIPLLVVLYTGIRPTEVPSVQIDLQKGAISVLNAKKKQYQKKDRREIPIIPPLAPYSEEIAAYNFAAIKTVTLCKAFKRVAEKYSLRDLRHTFQTYARITCSKEMVNLWTGHTLGKDMTDKVYNHIPWEEQKKQAATVFF